MNILFFTRLFYPHIGGVEKHVSEISKVLIAKGHKVTIITEDLSTKDIPIYLQSKGRIQEKVNEIKIYRVPVGEDDWFKKFTTWNWLFKHRILIKNADIIHTHDVFFWYLPFRFLCPFKKVFTTFHGYESYPISKKSIFIRKISEKLSFGNICVGEFMKKWYGTKPSYTTYGGVNIARNEVKIKNKMSAVFIGRLDEQTGILEYVKAVKLIREKIPNFKFEIIGDGKFRQEVEGNFKVIGFKKDPERYFSKYHFAFVSRYLSILEAMVAKRLVFALYDNPLKKDYLKMTPFANFINIVGSEKELTNLVFYFLKNSKKEEEMTHKAFDWVRNQSWENLTNVYLKIWGANKV